MSWFDSGFFIQVTYPNRHYAHARLREASPHLGATLGLPLHAAPLELVAQLSLLRCKTPGRTLSTCRPRLIGSSTHIPLEPFTG